MSLLTPLGFIALISLLVLALIYILKPKFEEQKVSSTFIWKLSLKYTKTKVPFEWLKNSLLLILQILTLLVITFYLTEPLITLSTNTSEEIIIIESSSGMNVSDGTKTRFESAIDEALDHTSSISGQKKFTVILAGKTASYVFMRESSKNVIESGLNALECGNSSANIDEALDLASSIKELNPNASITLYGCKDYSDNGIVNVVNLSNNEKNVAILDVNVYLESGYYEFYADLASYNTNANIAATLYINDKLRSATSVNLLSGEEVTVLLTESNATKVIEYESAYVTINYEDGLIEDNTFYLFDGVSGSFNVQIVSDNPFFLNSMFSAIGNVNITVVPITYGNDYTGEKLSIEYAGFDLYVFDNFNPASIPVDGSLWIIDPKENSTIKLESGSLVFGANTTMSETLDTATGLSSSGQKIIENITSSKISVSRSVTVTDDNNFETILTANGNPAFMIKEEGGVTISVMTFSLAYSNLSMLIDFMYLVNNICDYALQNTLNAFIYEANSNIQINENPACVEMIISSENITNKYTSFPVTYIAEELGVYSIEEVLSNGEIKTSEFFVRVPRNESNFNYIGTPLEVKVTSNTNSNINVEKETFNPMFLLALFVFVVVVIEREIQRREQY